MRNDRSVVLRVVFKVGVLHENVVAGCLFETHAQRRAFSLIIGLKEDAQIPMLRLQAFERVAGSID